ncbi:LPXTG cell wall anchor domain-containing protein [Actinoplanes sp. GCM10030250]|uniref:LPXTG cell wall anchor domain-containing protein n=1 Tax=Actinoplanes sp. GCM10030250 TaxID=3273376 RepID=UPI003618AAC3
MLRSYRRALLAAGVAMATVLLTTPPPASAGLAEEPGWTVTAGGSEVRYPHVESLYVAIKPETWDQTLRDVIVEVDASDAAAVDVKPYDKTCVTKARVITCALGDLTFTSGNRPAYRYFSLTANTNTTVKGTARVTVTGRDQPTRTSTVAVNVTERVDIINSYLRNSGLEIEPNKDFLVPAGFEVEGPKAVQGIVMTLWAGPRLRFQRDLPPNCAQLKGDGGYTGRLTCLFDATLAGDRKYVLSSPDFLTFQVNVLPDDEPYEFTVLWATPRDAEVYFKVPLLDKLTPAMAREKGALELVDKATGKPAPHGTLGYQVDEGPDLPAYLYVRRRNTEEPGSPSPSATASPSPSGTAGAEAPTAAPGGEGGGGLPVTGANTTMIAGGGVALVLLGALGFLVARRRRARFEA